MVRLKDISIMVQFILNEKPDTRSSDNILYYEVVKLYCQRLRINVDNLKFSAVFNSTAFPKFESVSRARRKLQAKYPDLRADDDVEAAREIEEKEYVEYSRS